MPSSPSSAGDVREARSNADFHADFHATFDPTPERSKPGSAPLTGRKALFQAGFPAAGDRMGRLTLRSFLGRIGRPEIKITSTPEHGARRPQPAARAGRRRHGVTAVP